MESEGRRPVLSPLTPQRHGSVVDVLTSHDHPVCSVRCHGTDEETEVQRVPETC